MQTVEFTVEAKPDQKRRAMQRYKRCAAVFIIKKCNVKV